MKPILKRILPTAFLALAITAGQSNAATIHYSDFIPDVTRTGFMGFETLPSTFNLSGPYSENNIAIDQINGDPNDIWTSYMGWGGEGSRSWYPNAGDWGYTRITLSSGYDFTNIGFLHGDGFGTPTNYLYYELLNNGAVIMLGTIASTRTASYLGFSGGGFDEIRLKTSNVYISDLTGFNAFAIDSIEISNGQQAPVPEPSTVFLLGAGLAGLGLYRRKFARK